MICLDNLSYRYAFCTQPAVKNISLEVRPGELMLVTGASGCGKSTLVRLVNGLCPHFFKGELSGEISVCGKKTADRTIQEVARDVGTVFQDPELQFFALQVADELAFAHEWQGKSKDEIVAIVQQSAASVGLSDFLESSIHDLSEGQKQKLAIASILSQQPKVLVFDEPTANLDPESTLELANQLQALKKQGLAILVVDHRLYWLADVADRVVVMSEGEIVGEGDFSLLADDGLSARYGLRKNHVTDCRGSLPPTPQEGTLEVSDLSFCYNKSKWQGDGAAKEVFSGVSFVLDSGITAIIGNNGEGKTTLARLLTGLLKMQEGNIFLHKEALSAKDILGRAAIVLQNTDHQLHMSSVRKELIMAMTGGKKGGVDEGKLQAMLEEINLAHLADRHPQSLSGGEKQRLVIACGLAKEPEILILDEPTSGLDGGNMQRIAALIGKAAQRGCLVLLITHDLEMLENVAERALRLPIED